MTRSMVVGLLAGLLTLGVEGLLVSVVMLIREVRRIRK